MNVLVTGGSGFIGKAVLRELNRTSDYFCTAAVRQKGFSGCVDEVLIENIDGLTDWSEALSGQDIVIHMAGFAHKNASVFIDQCLAVNVQGTMNLARQAAESGIKRLVFISSIGVNGNYSVVPFNETQRPKPAELYAQSKLDAEKALWQIQKETDLEIVIIRPPLVYGPNAPGNFRSIAKLISKSIPLPFGAINNKRSFISVGNLVDFICICINHPNAGNQLFLVSDGQDVSTSEFMRLMARSMRKSTFLLPIPEKVLYVFFKLLGKGELSTKLLGSLQVDISKSRNCLSWSPPLSMEESLDICFSKGTDCD